MAKRPKNGDSKEAQKRITECRESDSTKLDLSGLDLVSVPKELGGLTALTLPLPSHSRT